MSLAVEVTHIFRFEEFAKDAGEDWPDLPWPEWKPNTEKIMRPIRVSFTITVRASDNWTKLGQVNVSGPRIIKDGAEGANVDNDYYQGTNGCPKFVTDLVTAARFIVRAKTEFYNAGG